jgi:multiple sugar transport system ATP-binding protein
MIKIDLKNIVKEYQKGQRAVDDFSISAEPGDFIVLVGPSGCGKSTILRMIAGLEDITSGEILFAGKKINDLEPKDRNIGMVFQNYALYPHLTVYKNLAFPLQIKKINKNEIDIRVKEIADIVGLGDLLERKPKQLSGGQRQRVALARALVRKPDIFLFDEPLSNLDAKLRVQMRNDIINLHNTAKTTSVYVTHDQTEAMTMGTKIAVIESGKLQQYGTPDFIYSHPSNIFVAGFLGSPQMNFIKGKIEQNIFICDDFKIELKNISNNFTGNSTLGIRPEHIIITNENSDIRAKIIRIEYLGHEQLIYTESNSHNLCLRLDINTKYEINQTIGLKFLPDKIHIFDNHGNRI